MKITKDIIEKVLNIITGGLENGAGNNLNTFCVQQAVSKACNHIEYNDHPIFCVDDQVVSFGIRMNDRGWSSRKARADGMRRFAVAELGSNKVNGNEFMAKVQQRWHAAHPMSRGIEYADGDTQLREACEHAVQVLIEMKTEGSDYLYLTEPGCSETHKDLMKRLYHVDQLTWSRETYGCQGTCQKGHQSHFEGMR